MHHLVRVACLALPVALASLASHAEAQEAERAVRADGRPAPLKVIIRRPCPIYTQPDEGAPVRRQARPMEFFFVMPSPTPASAGDYKVRQTPQGWWYRVDPRETRAKGQEFGYVRSQDCTEWWHREAVGFLPREGQSRGRVRFYRTPEDWAAGYASADEEQDPKAQAIEPKRLGNGGFVLPVLGVQEQTPLPHDGSQHDLFRVAFVTAPQAPPADAAPDAGGPIAGLSDLAGFTVEVVFVIDESGSMREWIVGLRDVVREISEQLRADHPALRDRFRFGLVTYAGAGSGTVRCTLAKGASAEEFGAACTAIEAAGGGEDGEDVLAGLSLAVNGMDWGDVAMRSVLLIGDECGYEPDHHPELNSTGTSFAELRRQALPVEAGLSPVEAMRVSKMIDAIEIQNEGNGPGLSQLRARQFEAITKGGDYPGERWQVAPDQLAGMKARVLELLRSRITAALGLEGAVGSAQGGSNAAGSPRSLMSDPAWAGIPAPFREMIEMLGPADTTALQAMQEAWISRSDPFLADMVSERFLVTRVRLTQLGQMLEAVGTDLDQPGVNAASLVAMMQQRLAATSIDQNIGPQTPLKDVFEIVGGLPIRTPLMELTAEQVGNQNPADRRRMIEKLQRMARALDQQLHQPDLWFKLDASVDDRDALAFITIADFR